MAQFTEDQWYETITPGCCHVPFAMSWEVYQQRLKDHNWWWCPGCGSHRHFTGETKLAKELRETKNELNQTQRRLSAVKAEAKTVSGKYQRMKKRVINGVCPCCNRSFENLARHMATKHAEFGDNKKLKVLRECFGLTQTNLADDLGVSANQVSAFENDKPMTAWAREEIVYWMNTQSA